MRKRTIKTAGFTLVELMAVVVIIALLASTVSIYVISQIGTVYEKRVRADMRAIQDSIKLFRLQTGRYPESLDELMAGSEAEGWCGPYLDPPPIDPWDRPYIYAVGVHGPLPYEVKTLGKDGVEGGTDENTDYSSFDIFQKYAKG